MEYNHLPLCNQAAEHVPVSSLWQKALQAWHGDDRVQGIQDLNISMHQDAYCQQLCIFDTGAVSSTESSPWHNAIAHDYRYQPVVDGLPVAVKTESSTVVSTRYWGGLPVGRMGGYNADTNNDPTNNDDRFNGTSSSNAYLYNHWTIVVYVANDKNQPNEPSQVVRTVIEPYSIQHRTTDTTVRPVCNTSRPIVYDALSSIPPQPATGMVLMTYDVVFLVTDVDAVSSRWDVFLTMDYGIPPIVQISAVLFGLIINGILLSTLWVWVNRDLSYKPVMMHTEEVTDLVEDEIKLWPLSTRLFFPPRYPLFFAVANGTGAHLFGTGLIFLFLFQLGLINQSVGAHILTPSIVIYVLSSIAGGYVAGRCMCIFHQSTRRVILLASSLTAGVYPLLGLVCMWLIYDILPNGHTAPEYHALFKSFPLLLLWVGAVFPLTMLGGWWGSKGGPINQFPVSEGSVGYHDLDLQRSHDPGRDEESDSRLSRCRQWIRLPCLYAMGGCLPVLCCFISYSYGIAGPVLLGQYASSNLNVWAPYLLFTLCAGLLSVLFLYHQARNQVYHWWWPAFWTAGSSGVWILILSFSWLFFNVKAGGVDTLSFISYFLFFFLISLAATLLTGFIGVLSCIVFCRMLYTDALRRSE
jgi:transmembrane 9 superfamily member 2/4